MFKRVVAITMLVAAVGAVQAELITNGSFELGSYSGSGGFNTLGSGSTAITGWTVGANSIDWIDTYWQASAGVRSIDLGGNSAGSVFQDITTVSGQLYRLTFDISGNPDGGNSNSFFELNATVGSTSQNFSYQNNHDRFNMFWQGRSMYFIGSGGTETLTFTSLLPPGAYGPALDNVSIQAVPEPFTVALGAAAVGLALRRRRRIAVTA